LVHTLSPNPRAIVVRFLRASSRSETLVRYLSYPVSLTAPLRSNSTPEK
jgi:hypothetical protein